MAPVRLAPVPTMGEVISTSMLGNSPVPVGRVVGRRATRTALSVLVKKSRTARCSVRTVRLFGAGAPLNRRLSPSDQV